MSPAPALYTWVYIKELKDEAEAQCVYTKGRNFSVERS